MKITGFETFILHVPVTRSQIADSTHQVTHWGTPGVIIHTDAGLAGYAHAHLPTAHPACSMLEYIPWLRDCFEEPATVTDGTFVTPQLPGAGTTLKATALNSFNRLKS